MATQLPRSLAHAADVGDIDSIQSFLDAGGSPDARWKCPSNSVEQMTMLMLASGESHLPLVDLLIDCGANVDLVDSNSCTALMISAFEGHAAVVKRLVQAGARLDVRNSDGLTALEVATDADVRLLLRTASAAPAVATSPPARQQEEGRAAGLNDKWPTFITTSSPCSAYPMSPPVTSASASAATAARPLPDDVASAAGDGDWRAVRAWLDSAGGGADAIDAPWTTPSADVAGVTMLMLASGAGDAHVVERLLAHGACLDAQDSLGSTALMWAALTGHAHAVRTLVRRGATLSICDAEGATALSLAAREGHAEVLEALREPGRMRSAWREWVRAAAASRAEEEEEEAAAAAAAAVPTTSAALPLTASSAATSALESDARGMRRKAAHNQLAKELSKSRSMVDEEDGNTTDASATVDEGGAGWWAALLTTLCTNTRRGRPELRPRPPPEPPPVACTRMCASA